MIFIELSDQLGNQMFCYASAKAVAQKNGYTFKCKRRFLPQKYINDSDKKYGSDLPQIFNVPANEILSDKEFETIKNWPTISEKPADERTTTFESAIANCPDNIKLGGHLISTRYFDDMLPTVRNWFQFPQETQDAARNEIERIKSVHPNKTLCAVHFRVGRDYTRSGFKLGGGINSAPETAYYMNLRAKTLSSLCSSTN